VCALLGGLALSAGVGEHVRVTRASPQTARTWLSLQGLWLCRTWVSATSGQPVMLVRPGGTTGSEGWQRGTGWFGVLNKAAGGVTHCTLRWHVARDGHLISDMSGWVPNPTGEWPEGGAFEADSLRLWMATHASQRTPTGTKKPPIRSRTPAKSKPRPGGTPPPPGGAGHPDPWSPVPGHPSYRLSDFAGDPFSGYFGVCTWYAWDRHRSEPLLRMGNAASWPYNAPRFGLRVGSTPIVGATVVFQPGVEGAGAGGHAGHVEMVLGGGWFIISEMNFFWNGGGWGRVDWRYAYVGRGVSFIY